MLRHRVLMQKKASTQLSGSTAYSSAAVGNVLLSDRSFVTVAQYVAGGYLPAVGIIFSNSSGQLKAVSLVEANKAWDASTTPQDISTLYNYYYEEYYPAQPNLPYASADTDDTGNTSKIIAALGAENDCAANYCRNFSPSGMISGQWDLPSYATLKTILTNISTINSSLSSLSATILTPYNQGVNFYLSSTEAITPEDDIAVWSGMIYDSELYMSRVEKSAILYSSYYAIARPVITITY